MTAVYEYDGHTLEITTDRIEVTSNLPQPDPRWTFTDSAGHHHHTVSGTDGLVTYPTLVLRSGPATWCQDCHDEHTDAWWECRLCEKKISPGVRYDNSRRFIPGMITYLLDGEHCSPDEARTFVARWQRELNHRQEDSRD